MRNKIWNESIPKPSKLISVLRLRKYLPCEPRIDWPYLSRGRYDSFVPLSANGPSLSFIDDLSQLNICSMHGSPTSSKNESRNPLWYRVSLLRCMPCIKFRLMDACSMKLGAHCYARPLLSPRNSSFDSRHSFNILADEFVAFWVNALVTGLNCYGQSVPFTFIWRRAS